ncbi:MAG: type I 3-dehydroquinate dehydratase [Rhodoferax sp.]|nr:type I 3-dehydroquinate dehydratase [Rhodoferax sp.]
MHAGKPIVLPGQTADSAKMPIICTPLVGRSREEVLAELQRVVPKAPDLLEWRVDFFDDIGNTDAVITLAAEIRKAANSIPVLFTRRSAREGGEKIALDEAGVLALYAAVMDSRSIELIDYEMVNEAAHIAQVRAQSRAKGIQLVLSFHNFSATPSHAELCAKFALAQSLGADIAKVAVMPQRLEDVLTVLSATLESSQKLDIPLISMSMGAYGSLTRLFGWTCGSAMSFAIGVDASAPGQVPIEDVNAVVEILKKSLSPKK